MEEVANGGVNGGLWGAVLVFGILLAIAVVGLLVSTRNAEARSQQSGTAGGNSQSVRPNERSTQVRSDEARPEAQIAR